MRYDLSIPFQADQARARLETLVSKGASVDITEKAMKTLSQLRYLHAALRYLALRTGSPLGDVKEYYKRKCSPDIFVRQRYNNLLGCNVEYLRSSGDLTKEEMTLSIDRFRMYAPVDCGEYIPSPDDYRQVLAMENEVERNLRYIEQ